MHDEFDPKRSMAATPRTEQGYASFLGLQLDKNDGVVPVVAVFFSTEWMAAVLTAATDTE